MIAHLSELHDKVHQVFHLGLVLDKSKQIFGRDLILDPLVQHLLSVSHLARVCVLSLGSDFQLDVILQSAEHKRLEDEVKPPQLVLVNLTLVG